MLDNIGLMQGLGSKMSWLNQKQGVIAQNVANADTPGYLAHEIEEVDFGAMMNRQSNRPTMQTTTTNNQHIGGQMSGDKQSENNVSRDVYEASPSNNSVVIEEQLLNAQAAQADYSLITNLYKKNVSMLKMVTSK